jgi:hypothetical protein
LAFIYWIFCYSMSLASRRLEQRWLGCGKFYQWTVKSEQ